MYKMHLSTIGRMLFFLFLFSLGLFSCSDEMIMSEEEIEQELENEITTRSSLADHQEIVKIFSKLTETQNSRDFFVNEINSSTTVNHHSISFLELLQSENINTFVQGYSTASLSVDPTGGFDMQYLIETYLVENPNLSISLYSSTQLSGTTVPYQNKNTPIFSELIYDEENIPNEYKIFKSGTLLNTLVDSEPKVNTFVIQNREGFTSLSKTQMNNESTFNDNSKVFHCQDLVNKIKSDLNFNAIKNDSHITINGVQYINPFKGLYFITDEDITNEYNNSCTSVIPPPTPPPTPPTNYICDNTNTPSKRSTWNTTVNDEVCSSIRLPAGNDLLELNNDWCAWWNKNCRFQIDIFVPTKFNSTTFATAQPGPYFIWFNEKDLKKKEFVLPAHEGANKFIPWFFEEGDHGDEWKYLWTGKHRKLGETNTYNVGNQLGAKATFKVDGVGVELNGQANQSQSIQYTNKDLPVGGDFVYWCLSDPSENENQGTTFSTNDVEFRISEGQ